MQMIAGAARDWDGRDPIRDLSCPNCSMPH
jgi:hypothetical protein